MGSPQLAQYADFYADMTRRFGLTDSLELWRDISERLHQLTPEPEGVTYREVTANGVPSILVMPADSSPDHILLHSHSGGGVTASMWQERKAVGHLAKAAGARALVINYRLAPEDKFPAQIDDVEAAYRWLLGQGYDPSRIASSGDSIGGNFAAATGTAGESWSRCGWPAASGREARNRPPARPGPAREAVAAALAGCRRSRRRSGRGPRRPAARRPPRPATCARRHRPAR